MRAAILPMTNGYRQGRVRQRLAQTSALGGALAAVLVVTPARAQSLPSAGDGVVMQGAATITNPSADLLTVTVGPAAPRTVIDWNSFDIGAGQTAEFRDGTSGTAPLAVLNRVIGVPEMGSPDRIITQSRIAGNLLSDSNISVYILNPQGVLFTTGATTQPGVSVGSLIVSSLNVSDAEFMAGGGMTFSGSGTGPITVDQGVSISATAASARGIIALIGARVDTRGTLNATGDVALVAADSATVNLDGSPLSVTIAEGTQLTNPIVAYGTIEGRSVLLAAATHDTITNALLDVQATITATTAFATDSGIVLAAGTGATGVSIPGGAGLGANGAVSLELTGDLTATGDGGGIEIRAKSGITATTSPGVLSAAQGLVVAANAGDLAMGDGIGGRVTISTVDGAIMAGDLSASIGNVTVTAGAGAVTLGDLVAAGSVSVAGNSIQMGSGTAMAGNLVLDGGAATGNVTATTLSAQTGISVSTGGTFSLDSATAIGSAADISVSAGDMGGPGGGATTLSAGGNILVSATNGISLATAAAGGNLELSGTTVTAAGLTAAGGTLLVDATVGPLTLGTTSSQWDTTLTAATALTATGSVSSSAGSLAVSGGSVAVDTAQAATSLDVTGSGSTVALASGMAGTVATITAAGAMTLGTVDATRIGITAGGALTAARLSATQTGTATDALAASAASLAITAAQAGGTALLFSTGGDASVGSLVAGHDAFVSAAAQAVLGAASVGRDLGVSGVDVRLGSGTTAIQSAGRTASYTATGGTVATVAGTSGLVLRGDAVAIGAGTAGTGAILLDASTGIALGGVALVTGDPAGTANTGDIGIRLATAGSPLTLGMIAANGLRGITSGSPLTVDGAVTLGSTMLSNGLTLSTPGAISLAGVTISGAGQALSLASTGAATMVTATGTLSALAGVAVGANGDLSLADVSSGTGATTIASEDGAITAGMISGGPVTATAWNALSLASVAANGSVALSSNTAGISVTGDILAGGDIGIDAPGTVQLSDVRSTAGTIGFGGTTPTGIIFAGAVRAFGGLTAMRGPGLSFASATSDTAAVTLSASDGDLIVSGGVNAATATDILGGSVSLGSLTSGTTAGLISTGAMTVSGDILAGGDISIDAPGTIQLRDVRSTAGTIGFGSTTPTGTLSTRAVRAFGGLSATRAPGLSFASATSDTAGVTLAASDGDLVVSGGVDAATATDILGGSVSLGSLTSGTMAGLASTGAITVTGDILAGGDITIDAPGTVQLRDVRSTAGTIGFGSTTPPTGTISANAVRAFGGLTATRSSGLSFASATSDTAAVTLSASDGGITVLGATRAGTDVDASGLVLAFGAVTADTGHVDLFAADTLDAGALSAGDYVLADGAAGVTLASATSTNANVGVFGGTGPISVTGPITATGRIDAAGNGPVTLGAVTSSESLIDIESSGGALRVGVVDAALTVDLSGATDMSADSVRARLGDASLTAAAGALTVTGSVNAGGAVLANATGDVTLGSVTATGDAESLLRAAGGLLSVSGAIDTVGAVTARGATGAMLGSVTSHGSAVTLGSEERGVTAGVVSAAGDATITAQTGVTLGALFTEAGAGSVRATTGDVTIAGAVSTGGGFEAVTPGTITLASVTARGGDVLLDGGTVLAGAVAASDSVVLRTLGSMTLASVASTDAAVAFEAGDMLTVTGATTAQDGVTAISAGAQALGDVTSRGGSVLLTATAGPIAAGAVSAGGLLDIAGETGVTLGSARSVGDAVALGASAGALTVTGATRARGAVGLTARDRIALGDVTSDLVTVTVASDTQSIGAAAVMAVGAIDLAGATGVSLGSAISSGDAVAVRSGAGGVAVSGAMRAASDVLTEAAGVVALDTVVADAGMVTIRSADGGITTTSIDAGTSLEVSGENDLSLGSVTARGIGTGGSALLISRSGGITASPISTATSLDVDAATHVSLATAAVGREALVAGRDLSLGIIGAQSLDALARGGDLSLDVGTIRGAATLVGTGATGTIAVTRLAAVGPIQITGAGAVRADLLDGGAATIIAAGDVSGRSGGLAATTAALTIDTGGAATMAAVITTGAASVTAGGAARLTGAIDVGGDLLVRGATVTLGDTGTSLTQRAAGSIQVVSTTGGITGLDGLTLRSDATGAGGHDVELRSAAGLRFAPGTLVAGGTDRQSALQLVGAAGAEMAFDGLEARTIVSPAGLTRLEHSGNVTIARAATRDSLAITLSGDGAPALSIDTAEVRAGDLSLDAAGALSARAIAVAAGTTTMAGASVSAGPILTRALSATARATDATFSTIDATAGAIAIRAEGDIAVTRATANESLTVTSIGGDVVAGPLTGGSVAVLADASNGSRGAISLTEVSGAAGVDLSGRTITAEALTASAGAVTVSTQRDSAMVRDQAMTIGTIDAAGAITLSSGNRVMAGSAPITLGRATSSGGPISITTIGGGLIGGAPAGGDLRARVGDARPTLAADTGAITLDIDGAAVLGAVSGRQAMIVADNLDVISATATGGALALTTRNGPLVLETGSARGAATLDAGGAIMLGALDAASATLTGSDVATLGMVRATVGDVRATVAGALDATTLQAARDIVVDAGTAWIASADAQDGMLAMTARSGALRLDVGHAATGAQLTAPTISIGTLDAGSADLAVTGDLRADRVTTVADMRVTAGRDAVLGIVAGGGDVALAAGQGLTLGTVTTPAALTLTGSRIAATMLDVATLDVTAGADGLDLGTTQVTNRATLVSGGAATLDRLEAGTIDLRATGALTATLLGARNGLDIVASSAAIAATRIAGGGARLRTGESLMLTEAVVTGDLDLVADGALDVGSLDVTGAVMATGGSGAFATLTATGDVDLTAWAGDMDIGSATIGGALATRVAGIATVGDARVGGAVDIGADRIAAGTITTPATLTLTGRRIDARTLDGGTLSLIAGTAGADLATVAIGEDATLLSGGDLAIGTLASTTAQLSAAGAIRLGTATVTDTTTLTTAGARSVATRAAGGGLSAVGTSITIGQARVDGAVDLTALDGIAIERLAAGSLIARGDAIAVTDAVVGHDVTLDGGSIALGSAVIGGSATIAARGRMAATTLDVGGRLDVTAGTLALATTTVRGGDASLTADDLQIGTVSDSGTARLTARQAIVADLVEAGAGVVANAGRATIGGAIAAGGDLAITTTSGDIRLGTARSSGAVLLASNGASAVTGAVSAGTTYRIDASAITLGTTGLTARQAANAVALTARTGTITAQGATTLAGPRGVTLTARGPGGGIAFAPETATDSSGADVMLATTGAASIGAIAAPVGAVRIDAADVALTRAVTAQSVTLNTVATTGITRIGDTAIGNEAEFGASGPRFDLSNAEIALISAPTVTIASGARDVVVGAVGLTAATGSTRFAITASGRIDMLGRFVANGSPASRTIAFGNAVDGGLTRVIRVASTPAEGGRLLVGGATLDLTADRIGMGFDRNFLDAIGYRTGIELAVDLVSRLYVARPESTLYNAAALGGAPYADPLLLQAGALAFNYGRYALVQNSAAPGLESGVVLGGTGAPASGGAPLQLTTPGSVTNAFALFGTIDGISGRATALLGPSRLAITPGVSPTTSRINGCIIGSGAGCLSNSIAQPTPYVFDTSRAEIVRTADDLTLPFDPLIGTNNEALYLDNDVLPAASNARDCEGQTPCPTPR